ncbi:MAG TPA: 8-oxo-dGTP diphosphatase [Gemmataceae bacterium]
MPYTPILATLGYVLSPDRARVLLVHRNRRPGDAHFGKYNGLGGKLEPGEDVVACVKREVREESGIECDELVLRGTVSWPGFGKHGEDWFGFIFRVERWHGEPWAENPDGELVWVEVEKLIAAARGDAAADLPMWEGDRFFLPLVFERSDRQFHGVMPYRDGRPVSWHCSLV